ncbi:MAG: metallophosphoesterase [Planctomycetes bacterium]|nr:metallophosphoesterase [Planctomycetota bacterium]
MFRPVGTLLTSILSLCTGCGIVGGLLSPSGPAATHDIPPFMVAPAYPSAPHERFIAIGDMGTGRQSQRAVAAAMADRARVDGLDFIITVGDNIYPNGVRSADDDQWKSKFEDVYADPSLQVPIYPTLGNHDHRGSVQAQIEYSDHNDNWRMPASYYTFTRSLVDGTRVQFFAVDTTPINAGSAGAEAQLAWLDGQLGGSDADWKIVFGHHPLFGHNPWRGYNESMIASLEPLFTRHAVDLYLAGHDHALEMLKPIDGVSYVITGAGGGPDKAYPVEWTDGSYYAATGGGFTLIRLSKSEIIVEFVRMDGETQYAHTIMQDD